MDLTGAVRGACVLCVCVCACALSHTGLALRKTLEDALAVASLVASAPFVVGDMIRTLPGQSRCVPQLVRAS